MNHKVLVFAVAIFLSLGIGEAFGMNCPSLLGPRETLSVEMQTWYSNTTGKRGTKIDIPGYGVVKISKDIVHIPYPRFVIESNNIDRDSNGDPHRHFFRNSDPDDIAAGGRDGGPTIHVAVRYFILDDQTLRNMHLTIWQDAEEGQLEGQVVIKSLDLIPTNYVQGFDFFEPKIPMPAPVGDPS